MKCSCPKIGNPLQRNEEGTLTLWGNTFWEWGQVLVALSIFYGFYMVFFYGMLQAAYAIRLRDGTYARPGTEFPVPTPEAEESGGEPGDPVL